MINFVVNDTQESSAVEYKKRSQFKEVTRRLSHNKMAMIGLAILITLILMAVFADVIAPDGYDNQNFMIRHQGPSREHWFGTDHLGRSIFDRIVHGSRISLSVGIISVGIAIFFGGALGAVAGYYGGVVDNAIMRFMDILLAIPSILLAISIVSALGGGLFNVMLAVGISSIPGFSRITRASIITIKEQEFVEAARAVGASDTRIIRRHLLPNALAPIIVQGTLGVASAILSAAGLSFLGLGLSPPTPEWGAMLSAGRDHIRDHTWSTLFPGLFIMITILSLNLLGDGLRDALDPKLKN